MKTGSSIILPTHNTIEEVVVVSRRNDSTKWCLPGGKVEIGETSLVAAIRETYEECGIDLHLEKHLLQPIYTGRCYGDGQEYWVTTYLFLGNTNLSLLKAEEGFLVKQMEMIKLCQEANSPFSAYNQNVISSWRSFFREHRYESRSSSGTGH